MEPSPARHGGYAQCAHVFRPAKQHSACHHNSAFNFQYTRSHTTLGGLLGGGFFTHRLRGGAFHPASMALTLQPKSVVGRIFKKTKTFRDTTGHRQAGYGEDTRQCWPLAAPLWLRPRWSTFPDGGNRRRRKQWQQRLQASSSHAPGEDAHWHARARSHTHIHFAQTHASKHLLLLQAKPRP